MRRRRTLAFSLVGVLCCVGLDAAADEAATDVNSCPEANPTAPAEPDRTCTPAPPRELDDHSLVPDLAVLKSPEAPAFAALDVAPTAIARPGTPTGAALALVAGLTNGVTTPGQNVAIDIAPYWLVSHPTLTAAEVEREWWHVLRRTSISLASTTGKVPLPDVGGALVDTDVGRVAFGVHASLLPGSPSDAAKACGRVVDDYMAGDVAAIAAAEPAFVAAWMLAHPRPRANEIADPIPPPANATPEAKARYIEEVTTFNARKEAANADFVQKIAQWSNDQLVAIGVWRKAKARQPGPEVLTCLDVIHHRKGLMLDAAFAEVLNFPGNDIRKLDSNGSWDELLWLTGGYTKSWGPKRPGLDRAYDLSLLGLLKYDWHHVANADGTNRAQVGARVVLAFDRWGFGTEGLLTRVKLAGVGTNAYRVSATVDYHLKTGMWLTLTGGAELDADGKPTVPIGLASFQANFGRDRLLRPDTTVSQLTPAPGATP